MATLRWRASVTGAALAALLISTVVVTESAAASSAIKLAGVFPGAITDKSWNQAGYEGLVAAGKATHGLTSYAENVGPADQVADFRSFAAKGYTLVFGHGGQYQSAAMQVASQYPKTKFVVITGSAGNKKNVASYTLNFAQFAYIEGFIASKLSKHHHVCGIAGLQGLPPITQQVGGWDLGAKAANPKTKFTVVYLASMEDIAAAHSAAATLASHGCDAIFADLNAGQTGAVQGAAAAHAWTNGLGGTAATQLSARWVLSNLVENWSQAYVAAAEAVKSGHFRATVRSFGYNTKPSVGALAYNAHAQFNPHVPLRLRKAALKLEHELATGKLKVNVTKKDAAPGTH